jgi:hypothetical protein
MRRSAVRGQARRGRISATIALAISCSPITTLVAPCVLRWSISTSEWARAMMGRSGLSSRACATTWPPSNASGIATRRQRAAARFTARITSGSAALPTIASPLACEGGNPVGIVFDHQQRGLGRESRADEAANAAVAHQDHMIGETAEWNGFAGGGLRSADRSVGRCRSNFLSCQPPVERGKEQWIEQNRKNSAGKDEIAAALG